MKAYITLFGETPEIFQKVQLEFEYKPLRRWFLHDLFDVNFVRIEDMLLIRPTDLEEDLRIGIAEAIGEHPEDITIICEVECINLFKEPKVIMEEIGV
jgi:hypothetical protein